MVAKEAEEKKNYEQEAADKKKRMLKGGKSQRMTSVLQTVESQGRERSHMKFLNMKMPHELLSRLLTSKVHYKKTK
jgi:hypothetical protein